MSASCVSKRRAMVLLGCVAGIVAAVGPARAAGPTDDYFWDHQPVQWGLLQVGAPTAWTASRGSGAVVGIVDSGVDAGHEDLVGKVMASAECVGANGNSRLCGPGGSTDTNGHGTHIAGIIAANTNNGIGVAGMAPDARLVVARAVDDQGSGSDADVGAAIQWVVDHGATVVNLSLGVEGSSRVAFGPGFTAGARYAWSHGAVPVVAAGNSGQTLNYGSLDIVVVAATTPSGQLASYSNSISNAKWGVAAPGGSADGNALNNVVSTYPGNLYASIAGTSMATAHVSGLLALLRAEGLGRDAAVQRLLQTSVACGGCGSGRIDAAAATGAGAAPAPTGGAPPGDGGTPPGEATVVGPAPSTRPAAVTPRPRAAATIPRLTATTRPPVLGAPPLSSVPASTEPPTTQPDSLNHVALGQPFPERVDSQPPDGDGGGRAVPVAVAVALTSLVAGAGALVFRRVRKADGQSR